MNPGELQTLVWMILLGSPRELSISEISYLIYRLRLPELNFFRTSLGLDCKGLYSCLTQLRELGLIDRKINKWGSRVKIPLTMNLLSQLVQQPSAELQEVIYKILRPYEIGDQIV